MPRCLIKNKNAIISVSNTSSHPIGLAKGQIIAGANTFREFSKPTNTFFCNRIAMQKNRIESDGGQEQIDESNIKITPKDLDIGDLTSDEQTEIANIINESGVIKSKLGRVDCMEHEIDTGNAEPINQRQYRTPIAKRETMLREAEKMLVAGVVKPSTSPWNSPVVLVAKPNGETRFAIDFRRVNAVTKKQSYPVPRIDDCLNSLGTASTSQLWIWSLLIGRFH